MRPAGARWLPAPCSRRRGCCNGGPDHQRPSGAAAEVSAARGCTAAGPSRRCSREATRKWSDGASGRRGIRSRPHPRPGTGCRSAGCDRRKRWPLRCSLWNTGCFPPLFAQPLGRDIPYRSSSRDDLRCPGELPDAACLDLGERQARHRVLRRRAGAIGLGIGFDRRHGVAAAPGRRRGDAGRSGDRLPRNSRRAREDAAPGGACRTARAPRPRRACARRWREHELAPFDLVAVNLYPFQATIAQPGRHVRGRDREHRHRRAVDAALGGQELRVRAAGGRPRGLRRACSSC